MMFVDLMDKVRKAVRFASRRRSRCPREIQIELTNRCNSGCEMCPHTTGNIPEADFPLDLLDLLLAGSPPIANVVLTGWGEPLLHPSFLEVVERTREAWPSSNIRFTTNGLLLEPSLAHALLERQLAGITVSIDLWPGLEVADPPLLRFLHPPSKRVVEQIRSLAETRGGRRRPIIRLQSLALPVIRDHTRRIINFAAESGIDEVNLVRLVPDPSHMDVRPLWEEEQALLENLIGYGVGRGVRVRSVNRQPVWLRAIRRRERYCLKTDDSVYVTVEGEVTPCCNLREYSFGNLREVSGDVLALWHSTGWDRFFHNQRPVCGSCDALAHPYLLQPRALPSKTTTG